MNFIRSLSLGLLHRWVPGRLFVFVYTAYMDESGTHGDSPVIVMGGMLARADQWKKFEIGFDALRAKHGFRVLHAKEVKARTGDFRG